jgi:hypothetical protein
MIEKRLLAALLFLPLLTTAQDITHPNGEPIHISKTLTARPGEVYLDSTRIDLDRTFLNPENIKERKVFKAVPSDSNEAGATLITREVKGDIIPLTDFAQSIKDGSTKLKNVAVLKLMVNDKFVTDPENYRIELSAVRRTSILNYHEKDATHDASAAVVITIKGFKIKE